MIACCRVAGRSAGGEELRAGRKAYAIGVSGEGTKKSRVISSCGSSGGRGDAAGVKGVEEPEKVQMVVLVSLWRGLMVRTSCACPCSKEPKESADTTNATKRDLCPLAAYSPVARYQ